MSDPHPQAQPQRAADIARLNLTRLRIEDGVSLDAVFRCLTEVSAATLNVERVGVWMLMDEGRLLRCVDLFERSKATHSAGITLPLRDFPEYLAALDQRKTIPAESALEDPRTRGLAGMYLAPLGVSSLLDAGIFLGGRVVGVICHEHVGAAREWSTEERDFAGSMADIVALKIRAAELEDAKIALRTHASQLAESRRLDSIAEMAGGVAHDFGNILAVILTSIELIQRNPSSPDLADYLENMKEACIQGNALNKDLMALTRPEPHSSRVIRPAEVVTAQLALLQTAAGDRHPVDLKVHFANGRVLIAPDQLERVVLNLVINARDATPQGGAIKLTLSAAEEADDSGKRGRYFLIAVSDQGTGIAPEVLPRIFDPFYTTKPPGQGTGLGLAVVNRVVSFAGGFIRIDTDVGKGTTFRVHLPLVSSQG